MNLKKPATLIFTLAAAALLLVGCQTAAPAATTAQAGSTTPALAGTLQLSGSTSVQPLAETLSKAFMAANSGATVNVQGGGSSVGVADATSGVSDIGMVSRALKDAEKAELKEITVCIDGIDVIVNTANTVSDLTAEQITKIYKGEITNWKDVGGADEPIIVIQREAASGTRDAFQSFFKLVDDSKNVLVVKTALEFNSTGAVMTAVQGKPGAIGYASMGSVDPKAVKPLKLNGVEATQENVLNKTYAFQRPFVFATKGEPAGLAEAFIAWIFSPEGQALVSKSYITVPRQ